MAKDTFLKVRLDPADMLEIERQARVLNMPKSQFARLVLTGGGIAKPQQADRSAAGGQLDDSRLAALEAGLEEMRGALSQSAQAFDALLSRLNEIMRIPTFREYRGRLAAEGIEKKQNEGDEQFLIRSANRYFIAFSVWPNPSDPRAFGPVPAGVDLSKFPKAPPA
ncbi:MAG: hypothetical protein M0Z99_13295 [Betaproteobacteria bacterium]|nr:hypothetical protein [Betaproteobacteria bacterium]